MVADNAIEQLKRMAVTKCPEDKMLQEEDEVSDAELAGRRLKK